MRAGLNAKLSYVNAKSAHTYTVRCSGVRHGVRPIFTESAARVRKVYYPHLSTLDQFAIDVEMISQDEYTSLSTWMTTYIDMVFDPNRPNEEKFPSMLVAVPSRKFMRFGVPIEGFEWGDRAARMSWGITIVFETAEDVKDWTGGQYVLATKDNLSKAKGDALRDDVTQYFYPGSRQLSGAETPDNGTYAVPITLADIVSKDTTKEILDTGNLGIDIGTGN